MGIRQVAGEAAAVRTESGAARIASLWVTCGAVLPPGYWADQLTLTGRSSAGERVLGVAHQVADQCHTSFAGAHLAPLRHVE